MRQLLIGLVVLIVGALILSPAIALLGLDRVPGDIAFTVGTTKVLVPVAYSLCASAGLALLYYFLKG